LIPPTTDFSAPNAAHEWQAKILGWQSRNMQAACPLDGHVRSSFTKAVQFLKQYALQVK
jgi:hypothetical protein